jgi:VanZ family protein
VLAAVIAYGLLDEFTQPWTGRDFDWFDWAADIGGATCGAAISMLLMKKRG